jgi:hypothetical protein
MARKTWPIVVGGVAAAAVAAVVSVIVLDNGDEEREARERERERVVVASHAAELEREAARARAEAKILEAQAAALAAAEQVRVAAEEAKSRQEARAQAIEQARNAGILGQAALTQGGAFAALTGTGDFSSGFDDTDVYGGLIGNEPDEAAGGFGFGRSGFGPGGGGTGAGTIGLGTYGSLGHGGAGGTGSGYGAGGMGTRGLRGPVVRPVVSHVNGELDTAIVRRVLMSQVSELRACYQKQLLVEPGLEGTVTARFEIDETGAVTDASASGVNDEVASCVASVIRGAAFPKPKRGTVSVTSKLVLKPSSAP